MPQVALVVDDSMLIRHTVCRFLEERGFSVESATNGLDALALLQTILPDIIITDLQMPKMTGFELIRAVKGNPHTARIPVVVLASQQPGLAAKENRADYAICKDIDIEQQLESALNAALRSKVPTPE